MIIIWKRKGILIAIVAFAWLLLLDWACGAWSGNREYYADHGWPKLLGFWAAAASIYMMRGFLGVPVGASEDDAYGGASGASAGESELFFLKARYWPAILLGLGVVFAFV